MNTLAASNPSVRRVNRFAGWLALGVQLGLLFPYLLWTGGPVRVDPALAILYLIYLWTGFPFVTLFVAWLFLRAGAFRGRGPAWAGLAASFGVLLFWVVVLIRSLSFFVFNPD